jgi:predicted DNA-binding protein (MmcQ/YjbR family)
MLDEGKVNKEELLELVIKSHQQELPKSENEEVKVNVR